MQQHKQMIWITTPSRIFPSSTDQEQAFFSSSNLLLNNVDDSEPCFHAAQQKACFIPFRADASFARSRSFGPDFVPRHRHWREFNPRTRDQKLVVLPSIDNLMEDLEHNQQHWSQVAETQTEFVVDVVGSSTTSSPTSRSQAIEETTSSHTYSSTSTVPFDLTSAYADLMRIKQDMQHDLIGLTSGHRDCNSSASSPLIMMHSETSCHHLLPQTSRLPQTRQRFACPEHGCSKTFGTLGSLKRHGVMAHTNSRPHVCCLCSKAFKLHHHLKRHCKSQHNLEFIDYLRSVHRLNQRRANLLHQHHHQQKYSS
eukprot:c9572_g1_i1.p1 GENE.c9572_g1_i1~~c9572_g1_i1.p1  ORF type:complete len:329 (+),score=58.42 c9572_g1_i1:55-987(+)